MPTVDSLDIQISAESKKAAASLDNLCKKLDRVSASLSGVNSRGLATMGAGVNKLSNAMANFSKNTKTADFSRIARNLNELGKINPSAISSATKSIGKIAGAMRVFDGINVSDNAAKIAELSKGISSLGYKSAQNAVTNIPKLASAMRSFMKTLSTSPKVSKNLIDMTNAMARFARTGASGGRAASQLSVGISNMTRKVATVPSVFKNMNMSISGSVISLRKLKSSISSLLGTFGGIYAIFNGLKKSIDISSDLTEVQNVVDVAFGKYKKSIEDFSKISIKDFGMSELTAKTMAGRFQAMGTAIGFSQKKMSDMSVELTKLAADMASFYNVEQEDVAESLQSIFTGQTKPLRAYGLDLTQATIEEWAHKQGIDAKMKSMSQMEKTMLRYQYVMANTGAAQGDFARTADTWANQIRVLRQNFEVLGSVVGGVLINSLKPFVKGLNVIVGQITEFAKVISNALGKIFGWTYEEGGGTTDPSSEMDDMADSMDGIADSTDKATKKQKEFNKQLAKFDELNNYTTSEKSNSSGTGSGNGTGDTSALASSGGKWKQGKSIIKGFESDIDTLYKLGKTIGDTLKKSMDRIDWNGVYKKADNFGRGLANFLNGLISPGLFSSLGKTIAGSINTALHALNSFGKTFNWKNFGNSIASGINGFFKTFDWRLGAGTFNTLTIGVLNAAISAVNGVKWNKIRETIFGLVNGIDFPQIGWKLGKFVASLSNALYTLVSNKKSWKNLGSNIAKGINGFFRGNDWKKTGLAIGNSIGGILTALTTAMKTLDWTKVGKSIGEFISGINFGKITWQLLGLAKSIVSGIAQALLASFSKAPIETAIITMIAGLKFTGKLKSSTFSSLASEIVSKISTAIASSSNTGVLGNEIGGFLNAGLGKSVPFVVKGASIALIATTILKTLQDALNKNSASLFKDTKLGKTVTDANEAVKALKESTKALDKEMSSIKDSDYDFSEEGIALDNLATRYKQLADKEYLSVGEKKRLKEYAKRLTDAIPSLNSVIDKSTGAYTGEWSAIKKVIDAKKKEYVLAAKQEKLKSLAEKIAEAEEKQAKAIAKKQKAQKELDTYTAKVNKKIQDVKDRGGNPEWELPLSTYYKNIEELKKAVNSADKEVKNSNKTLKEANAEYDNLAENVENDKKVIGKATKTLKEHKKELNDSYKATKNLNKISANLKVDDEDAKKKISGIDKKLKGLKGKKHELELKGNNKDAQKKLKETNEKIEDLEAKKTTVKILGSNADAKTKLSAIEERRKQLDNKEAIIKAKGDTKDAQKKLKEINSERESLNYKEAVIKATVDKSNAESSITSINSALQGLNRKKAKIMAGADTKDAQNKLKELQKKIDKLTKTKFKAQLQVDVVPQYDAVKKTAAKYKNSNPSMYAAMMQYANSIAKKDGGLFKNGKWQNITKYAIGGMPKTGQMFVAREAGPELVGKIGNNTAVMNNNQIVSSVSDGVYKAVVSAMSGVFNAQSSAEGDIIVQIDGKEVFKAVRNQDKQYATRTGKSAFSY